MTESNAQPPQGTDPTLTAGSNYSSLELSRERITLLEHAASEMTANLPGYLGLTIFGSTARGEARPDSDVDMFVLIKPDDEWLSKDLPGVDPEKRVAKVFDGVMTGTRLFHQVIDGSYNWLVGDALDASDIKTADTLILPIDEKIITDTVTDLLRVAEIWDSGDKSVGARVPRNISALFQSPIDVSTLKPYKEQVLNSLAASPNGLTAWRMIRHQVAFFELGREKTDTDEVTHRNIPKTLAEAQEYYLRSAETDVKTEK